MRIAPLPRACIAALSLLAAAGCASPKIWITVQPRFDYRKVSTVAVLPFENRSDTPDAGEVAAQKLADLLEARTPWRIVTWRDIAPPVAAERIFPDGKLDPAAAAEAGRAAGADTVLTGTVVHYKSEESREVRLSEEPFPDEDSLQDGYSYEELPVNWYSMEAVADFALVLLDAATGKELWSDERTATASDRGEPPRLTESQVLDNAADSAARKLLLGLVPHQERVRIPRGSLVACGEYIDHPVDIRSAFRPSDGFFYLVIELESEFAGEEIVLTLQKPSSQSLVAEHRFVWDDASDTRAFKEDIRKIVDEEGCGTFRAAYSLEGREAAATEITIRPE